jgi:hypothetical protein
VAVGLALGVSVADGETIAVAAGVAVEDAEPVTGAVYP